MSKPTTLIRSMVLHKLPSLRFRTNYWWSASVTIPQITDLISGKYFKLLRQQIRDESTN